MGGSGERGEGSGWGVTVDVIEELKVFGKIHKKNSGGCRFGGGVRVGGVRVDVIDELKFL